MVIANPIYDIMFKRLIEGGNRSQFDKLREEITENKKTIEANKKALEKIELAREADKKELEELRELLKKKND